MIHLTQRADNRLQGYVTPVVLLMCCRKRLKGAVVDRKGNKRFKEKEG